MKQENGFLTSDGVRRTSIGGTLKKWMMENLLLVLSLVGVVVGFVFGFGLRELDLSSQGIMWVGMPGQVFLRLLTMVIVPLIVTSVISGCSRLDPRLNGKMGLFTFLYVLGHNALGSLIGLCLVLTIKPGVLKGISQSADSTINLARLTTTDIIADLIRNIFPKNVMMALIRSEQTIVTMHSGGRQVEEFVNNTGSMDGNITNVTDTITKMTRQIKYVDSSDLLGVLFFSTAFGIACSGSMREISKPIVNMCTVIMEILLRLMRCFLWFSPVGIASLICEALLKVSDLAVTFKLLGFFSLTVVCGLIVHQVVALQLTYFLVCRKNPLVMTYHSMKAWITNFATTSSYATMPEYLTCCEKHGLDRRVYGFTIPFCAGTNRNGSAIYVTSAAIFIAQMSGADTGVVTVLTMWLLVTVAMFALPGVPSGSMVSLLVILTATGLPSDGIALLFAMEWLLDRLRSTSNALSTCFCAAVVEKLVYRDIRRWDATQEKVEDGDKDANRHLNSIL